MDKKEEVGDKGEQRGRGEEGENGVIYEEEEDGK